MADQIALPCILPCILNLVIVNNIHKFALSATTTERVRRDARIHDDRRQGAKMTRDLLALAGLDRMIHEPARLPILTLLYPVASMDFIRLQRSLGYTKGNLSSHLAKLERAGYVALEKKFKKKYPLTVCGLTKRGRAALADYCEAVKKIPQMSDGPAGDRA